MTSMELDLEHPLSARKLTCPTGGKWTSFQLVDEFCSSEPYAGLAYIATDSEGMKYEGHLDAKGIGKLENHFAGPVSVLFEQAYEGKEAVYLRIKERPHYPLKITELQVRAEKTRYRNPDSTRTRERPALADGGDYFQVEVRHLVRHVSHLPPEVFRHFPLDSGCAAIMLEHGKIGAALMPNRHTVLEVRPLRALRPLLSTDTSFCALNLYQLALMATLSYSPFGQQPAIPSADTQTLKFSIQPSVGNWFGDALAKCEELWKVDSAQTTAFYPLYEDVPYSRRLEIIPFDPTLYAENRPTPEGELEHPASVHFLDDVGDKDSTDTQAFITHNDELILIAVRGTAEKIPDGLRDADALQVSFTEGEGHVHRGFYEAAQKAATFATAYLDRFYIGQKLLICGHSLGGAITLLLSEMLRRRAGFNYDIQLYTYGAPRAGDRRFVEAAGELVHYRMVNHNDPVPSVPGSWMNTKADVYGAGAALTFVNVPVGLSLFVAGITNWTGEAYGHHGALRHAMPVEFGQGQVSSILWAPGCDTITQHAACEMAVRQRHGLPDRPSLLKQLLDGGHHSMTGAYIPACWAALRRWQEAQEAGRSLVTDREFELIESALQRITGQLRKRRNELTGRPDSAVRAHQKQIDALSREVDRVDSTRQRLATLRYRQVKAEDVYGSIAGHPQRLAESLPRWQAHPQNLVQEQLAMAPDSPADDPLLATLSGRTIGAPYTLDLDSFI